MEEALRTMAFRAGAVICNRSRECGVTAQGLIELAECALYSANLSGNADF